MGWVDRGAVNGRQSELRRCDIERRRGFWDAFRSKRARAVPVNARNLRSGEFWRLALGRTPTKTRLGLGSGLAGRGESEKGTDANERTRHRTVAVGWSVPKLDFSGIESLSGCAPLSLSFKNSNVHFACLPSGRYGWHGLERDWAYRLPPSGLPPRAPMTGLLYNLAPSRHFLLRTNETDAASERASESARRGVKSEASAPKQNAQ